MNRSAFAACAVLVLCSSLPAQITFQRTYGGPADDGGQAVARSSEGGYFVAGFTASGGGGGTDIYVISTDEHGVERWTRTSGGAQNDFGFGVAATADGGCLAAGYALRAGQADVALHRHAADGTTLWSRTYGGSNDDMAYSVAPCADGGFVVAGVTYSFGSGPPNVYVIRTDSTGDSLWTRVFGGTGEDYAFSVRPTADAGFIICGTTYSYGAGRSDVWLVKTDASGDTQWTRTYGGADYEHGHSVTPTADSGYAICGTTHSFGAGAADIWLVRTDPRGDTLWTRTFGGDSGDYGHSVIRTADQGFALAGQTSSRGAGSYDALVIRTDSTGDTLWTRTFGGEDDDRAYSVQQTPDLGCVVAGLTGSTGAGGTDAWLIKTDSLGMVGIAEPNPLAPVRHLDATILPRARLLSVLRQDPDLSLFDASGRLVVSPDRLSPGICFIRARTDGPFSIRKVLIVE